MCRCRLVAERKRFFGLLLLLVIIVLVPGLSAAAGRAVWTWEAESYAMLENGDNGDEAIAFLRAKDIDTIYLYADGFRNRNLIRDQPELYRKLIGKLHRRRVKAYALLGSAYLHTEEYMLPAKRDEALAMFQRVLDYNATAAPEERFDGVNLDIEPHILPQWRRDKTELLRQFLDLGAALMELKRASGQPLAVGPAIPFWLDGIELEWRGSTRPVSEHVIDSYDYVALMDYRDHADGRDGLVAHAQDEIDYASSHGRRVVIGVEVTPNEIQKVSFDHLAEADMERELALVERAFRDQPGFAGFAIHHFRGYRKWLGRDGVAQ